MVTATMAIKLNQEVANKFKKFCKDRGIKYSFFIEEAIKQKLEVEELKEDLIDLKSLAKQEGQAIPLEEYLRKRDV